MFNGIGINHIYSKISFITLTLNFTIDQINVALVIKRDFFFQKPLNL